MTDKTDSKEREAFVEWVATEFVADHASEGLRASMLESARRAWQSGDDMAVRAFKAGRASLAASAGSEPVAWYEYNADLDAWFLAYNHNPKAKTRPLVFGDTTSQPTQAQAGAITPPPIECNTEELKRAYAFGWWSALEKQRETAQAGAVPLTDEQIKEVMDLVSDWGMQSHLRGEAELDAHNPEATEDEITYAKECAEKERAAWNAIKDKLQAHGIKGGQHGDE